MHIKQQQSCKKHAECLHSWRIDYARSLCVSLLGLVMFGLLFFLYLEYDFLSVQCNTLHGIEYKNNCGVCVCVRVSV